MSNKVILVALGIVAAILVIGLHSVLDNPKQFLLVLLALLIFVVLGIVLGYLIEDKDNMEV